MAGALRAVLRRTAGREREGPTDDLAVPRHAGRDPGRPGVSGRGQEVREGPDGRKIAKKNFRFIQTLLDFDVVIIAGQAKSHCVAWTIDDLLTEIAAVDRGLAHKVYLLEDCTSPVVIPVVRDST